MPTWTDLRRAPVALKTPEDEVDDHLIDPMAIRARERDEELATLGSGRGIAGQKRSDDPVRSDLRDMAEDPVFGKGENPWAGLTRPEELADSERKKARQDEWEARKGERGGVSRVGRGLHRLDKMTGHMGLDMAARYGKKGVRGYKEKAGIGGLAMPGYTGKGHGGFFDKKDFVAGAKSKGETAGRRMLGFGISGAAKLSGEAPIVGPMLGVGRDAALANYEANRAKRAGMIASRPDSDELTASLARGSKRRHEQRRDESGLKASVRGGLAFTMIPGLPSLGASAASSLKGGVDFMRSDARKTRLKASHGDDDALVKLGEDDQDFRRAMVEYLGVGEQSSGGTRAHGALSIAKRSEGDWSDEQEPKIRDKLGMGPSGASVDGGSAKAIGLDKRELSESYSEDSDDVGTTLRPDVMDPVPDQLPYDVGGEPTLEEKARQASLDEQLGEFRRVGDLGGSEGEHLMHRGALLDDMSGTFDPVAARQKRLLPELDDGSEHTLRPSLVAKRSRGEAARKRQRDRDPRAISELMELDESAWYDSRKRG